MSKENELDIDQTAIAAEAEAVPLPDHSMPGIEEGGAGAPTTSDAPAPMPEAAQSWSSITPGLVVMLDVGLCPNWQLTDQEKHELDGALAATLDQLFPGGIGNERWAPYFRLLAVAVGIAGARFDTDAMRFKPLRKPRAAEPAPADPTPPSDQGAGSFAVSAPGARQ